MVDKGALGRAKSRIKDLESGWDAAENKLRPRDPEEWHRIDKAIDAALAELRATAPRQQSAKAALLDLLSKLDHPAQSGDANRATQQPKLMALDVIAAAEKLRPGSVVADVSFEPKGGKPTYAVRTFGDGKVWDGVLDGMTGGVIDEGKTQDEASLDDEDMAELRMRKSAKITIQEATRSAQRLAGGTAQNAGIEVVHGHAVWEILVQSGSRSQQVHIDPVTGKLM